MKKDEVSRATLGRVPEYLRYLKSLNEETKFISATKIARDLNLGDVQVRKDLAALCGLGKPKTGYLYKDLFLKLEEFLGENNCNAVIVGAGSLGKALLDYEGFEAFKISIIAAFDKRENEMYHSIFPMEKLEKFCNENDVKIGIIAVPQESAQEVCDLMCQIGIKAIWNFAPCQLKKPDDVIIQYENLALSLANLKRQIK